MSDFDVNDPDQLPDADRFHVKTSAAGNDLLGDWRSFRVDRIRGRVKVVAR